MNVDFSQYHKLKSEYEQCLSTDDFNTAFRIMKEAAMLSAYYGEQKSEVSKVVSDSEFHFKHIKAKKSIELSPGKPTDGERMAMADEEVVLAHKDFSSALFVEQTLENVVKTIEKVYFDSKNVWDKGNYMYRTKRDDV